MWAPSLTALNVQDCGELTGMELHVGLETLHATNCCRLEKLLLDSPSTKKLDLKYGGQGRGEGGVRCGGLRGGRLGVVV